MITLVKMYPFLRHISIESGSPHRNLAIVSIKLSLELSFLKLGKINPFRKKLGLIIFLLGIHG
jgi:hypothetical protein